MSKNLIRLRYQVRTSGMVAVWATLVVVCLSATTVQAQSARTSVPVVVQPGAPGKPTKVLPSSTKSSLPPASPKDVEFMQGMIMHHAQAVEMTALIDTRTQNGELRLLGARISKSQADEIAFMKRWLEARNEPTSHKMTGPRAAPAHTHQVVRHEELMPGMLGAKQMDDLRNATGKEFERLFLAGMIQHHNGALVMVKDLFDTAGAGQDAEVFNFASDVDSGQRAEIRVMEEMLAKTK